MEKRAWIELDRSALRHNVAVLREMLPENCRLMPAVKANAYGHGAALIARELNLLGVDAFCVACAEEGAALRRAGIKGEILVLGYTGPEEFPALCRYRLTQTVVDFAHAEALNRFGKKLHVHIGIDTGMHRLGEDGKNVEYICRILEMENLAVDGLFTHLCASDSESPEDQAFTRQQAEALFRLSSDLQKRGFGPFKLHLLASYGILYYPEYAADYARVGIALYGVLSTKEDEQRWERERPPEGRLCPVMSLKASVASVRWLKEGESAGYGRAFCAETKRRIAALAIGYADGLPRCLSGGGGSVLIHGKRAPIVGRICMDQTLVDITDIPEVLAGDTAVLIGRSGKEEITACDLAEQSQTISNEILSRLGTRLARKMV